ncbi:MAG: zinc ribbon domain-containing protein [Spirochaetales bacterium]|nr:zinc ribbon domain-containing protein [Spirochaetales bacterium]
MQLFFCENCGAEVRQGDEVCSECGAFFVAIKCPRCGFRGKQHQFSRGCPACGYLSQEVRTTRPRGARGVVPSTGRDPSLESRGEATPSRDGGAPRTRRDASQKKSMPSWIFWLILGLLAASFGVLAWVYTGLG